MVVVHYTLLHKPATLRFRLYAFFFFFTHERGELTLPDLTFGL